MTSMRRVLTQLQTDTLMAVFMHHFHGQPLDQENLDQRSINSLVLRGLLIETEAAITITEAGIGIARRVMTRGGGPR